MISVLDSYSLPDCFSKNTELTIFHHQNWINVLKKQYLLPVKTIVSGDINSPDAIIPFLEVKSLTGKKKWVSLPFSDFTSPLYKKQEDLISIINYLKQKINNKEIPEIEIRCKLPEGSGMEEKADQVIHFLSLDPSIEELYNSFNKSQTQRGIQKAIKTNLTYKIRKDAEGLKEFYLLHLKTRKKQGVPVQPRSFFEAILLEIINKNLGFVLVIYHTDKPISAALFLMHGETFTYKFGASDPSSLILRPNHLLFWEAIKFAKINHYTVFDFGKTDIKNESLRKFKSNWGAKEKPLFFSYYPKAPTSGLIDKVNNFLVKPIIKNSPSFVCKITGEVLYKYMG